MIESSDRVAEFKAEVSNMRLADPALARDRALLRLAVALLVVGPGFAAVAYLIAHFTKNPLQQRDAIVSALFGVSLSVVGGALYLRYSMAGFLRFWLARLSYEQKAQTDRVVDALGPAAAPVVSEPVVVVGSGAVGPRPLVPDDPDGAGAQPADAAPPRGERRWGSRSLTKREP